MDVPYPLPTRAPYTGDKVKKLFQSAGMPVSRWAEANGYTRRDAYLVINGQFKGRTGRAHEIAVKLGMKLPVEAAAAAA